MQEEKNLNFILLNDIYYKIDKNEKILDISSSVEKMLGYKRGEVIGKNLRDFYSHDKNRGKTHKKIEKIEKGFMVKSILKHKDGRDITISSSVHSTRDEMGNFIGMEGISRNITKEEELKRRLLLSEKKCNVVFENSPNGVVYYDKNSVVVEANKVALKIFGTTKEKLVGFNLLKEAKDESLKKAVRESYEKGSGYFRGLYRSALAKKQTYLEIYFKVIKDEVGNIIFLVACLSNQTIMEKAIANLKKSKEEWKSVIDNIQNVFLQTDKSGKIMKVSPSIEAISGYKKNEIVGKNIASFWVNSKEMDNFRKKFLINPKPMKNLKLAFFHKSNEIIYLDCNISPRFDSEGCYMGSDHFAQDITELRKSQKKIKYMAMHDDLTELLNRTMLGVMLKHSIMGAKIIKQQIAILLLDIDNFKDVNDNFGHQEGDKVLIEIASRLKSTLRLDDMVFRFGGDEFVVIADHIRKIEDTTTVIKKIKSIFDIPFETELGFHYISCSIGVTLYPDDATSAQKLIKSADIAMHKAKNSGKNSYSFYSKEFGEKIQKELYTESLLREALQKDELEVYYQPQVSLESGKVVSVEALVRWNSKELGFMNPGDFIKIAEKTQLIRAIDEWVAKTACTQVKKWHDSGLYKGNLSVNISGINLNNSNMATTLKNILDQSGLDAKFLEIEITETVLMNNSDSNIKLFKKIKELGIDVSIDDFGTGYSSLSYLKMFPIDELKIDKVFVDDLLHSKDAIAITNAIISLAKNLGYRIVAEGVETLAQLGHLKALGCDIVQGYYHSKPLDCKHAEEYFKNFCSY